MTMGAATKAQAPAATDGPRARRAARLNALRRDLIVDAARRVFARDGLEDASMRAIATEAGCTTGAIYPLFSGKEALYAAVLDRALDDLAARVDRAVGTGGTARAASRGLAAFHAFYRERPDDLSLGLYLFGGLRSAGLTRELDAALNRKLQAIFARIETALAQAGEGDPRARVTAAVAQSIGLLVLGQTGRLKRMQQSGDDLFARFLETGWAGLGHAAHEVLAGTETTTGENAT